MRYDLKRPCKTCPFVRGNRYRLTPGRVEEIRDDRGEFPCHCTIDYDAYDGEPPPWRNTSGESHCVGHLIVQWSDWGGFNQVQAMAARCGLFDPDALPDPGWVDVFETWAEMIEFIENLTDHGPMKRSERRRCRRGSARYAPSNSGG